MSDPPTIESSREVMLYLAGDNERDGLYYRTVDLERSCDFTIRYAHSSAWHEAHASLRIGRFILVQGEELVILVFVVSDISITKEKFRVSVTSRSLPNSNVRTPCQLGITY